MSMERVTDSENVPTPAGIASVMIKAAAELAEIDDEACRQDGRHALVDLIHKFSGIEPAKIDSYFDSFDQNRQRSAFN